jgi:hypothetical protein
MGRSRTAQIVEAYRKKGVIVLFPPKPHWGPGPWEVWKYFFDGSSEMVKNRMSKQDASNWAAYMTQNRGYEEKRDGIRYELRHEDETRG